MGPRFQPRSGRKERRCSLRPGGDPCGPSSPPCHPPELSAVNFDLNKLGKLDDKEFAAWTAALRRSVTQSPAAMKRFDTDHDGRLDDAEWSVALRRLLSGI